MNHLTFETAGMDWLSALFSIIKYFFMEKERLIEARDNKLPWKKWGPYLSERQWGTVREDYSENGDAWNFFTHEHGRSNSRMR